MQHENKNNWIPKCPECGSLAVQTGIANDGHYEGSGRALDYKASLLYVCMICGHIWTDE